MTALDTNILARYILNDDTEQEPRARALVEGEDCLIPNTVLLELAWVLRAPARDDKRLIVRQLRALLGLPTLHVAQPEAIRDALDAADAGMDIADAFHRALSPGAERLATFDRGFVEGAAERPGLRVDLI